MPAMRHRFFPARFWAAVRWLMFAGFGMMSAVLHAASTNTWNGAGANDLWSNATNWGGTALATPVTLTFAGSTRLTPNNDTSVTVTSVTFSNTAGAFVIG